MPTDIEIARQTTPKPLTEVAAKVGILPEELEFYGKNKAKLSPELTQRVKDRPDGKLVLVTAITPTPAGEGKTTISIGLADGLSRLGQKTVVALREPSMGPVFGVKGGATGGGHAQIIPMEDINLHFTGDMHAITAANNLLAAIVDNHIYQGNGLDIQTVTWRRCMDMNDRQLRHIESGLGGKTSGVPRDDGFDITAASEVMATLCLSKDLDDLRDRLANIIVGYDGKGDPVRAGQLEVAPAMAVLLADAIKPNLVQTLEGTPALIHGGPFANIAHGCSTLAATRLARKLADITVTEAGFGADLGAEKFLDIKCRKGDIWPDACVIVATVRALKYHGGVAKEDLNHENLQALQKGIENLTAHVENIQNKFHVPTVVAINRFVFDTEAELHLVAEHCKQIGAQAVLADVWANGGEGAEQLAKAVLALVHTPNDGPHFLYPDGLSLKEKIYTVATQIYGAKDVEYSPTAEEQIALLTKQGMGDWPVCMAKTQMSLSDDAKQKGRPRDFTLHVRNARASAGAGFIVVLTGTIMTMPGLPPRPASENVFIDDQGYIQGIF